jgi:periplasmic protein TonB
VYSGNYFLNQMAEAYQGASPNARFLAGSLPESDTSWKSYLLRSSWSVVIHVGGLALLIWVLTRPATIAGLAKVIDQPDITWIAQPGPGGGGGGGGNKAPEPPRKAEITPPKTRTVQPPKPEPPKPVPQANIPAITSVVELPGATTAVAQPTIAQGTGTGGGGGTGSGTGVGPGTGSGYGEGFGGGTAKATA